MSGYPPTTILAPDIPTYTFVNTSNSLRVVKLPAASTVPGKLLYITNSAEGIFSTFTIFSSLFISTTGVDRFENQFHTSTFFTILSTLNTTLQVASDGQSNWMLVGLSQSSNTTTTLNPFIRSSFSPAQIGGLLIWFDAADTGTIVPSTNSQVAGWRSKAPAAGPRVTAVQTTGAQITSGATPRSRPALTGVNTLNGKNVLFFSTTCEMFFATAITSARTVFTVVNPLIGPDPTFTSTFIVGNPTANNYNLTFQYDSNAAAPYSIDTARPSIALPYTSVSFSNSPFLNPLIVAAVNGTTTTNLITVNGNAFPLATNVANSFTATALSNLISRHIFSTSFDLAEMLIYNTALATSDRQNVEGYLAWKWQLYENLPPSHPYRFNSPSFNFDF
jgi:hypothetical protein